MDNNQIYVCLTNKGIITLLPYHDIEQDIKDMEELEDEMAYTVIGPINIEDVIKNNKEVSIISWTDKKNTFRILVIGNTKPINYDAKTYKVRNITQEIRQYE